MLTLALLLDLSFISAANASIGDDIIRITPRTSQLLMSEENYLTYQNDTFSFKIDYPSTWMVAENSPDLIIRVQDVVVNFFSPPEHSSDLFSENLLVGATKLDENDATSLDDLPEKLTPYYKEIFGVRGSLDSEDFSLDGYPAKKLTYSFELFGKMVENTQVFSIKSGYIYAINYICEISTCPTYLPTFEKIVQSFEFT